VYRVFVGDGDARREDSIQFARNAKVGNVITTNHRETHTELVQCVVIVSSSFGSKKKKALPMNGTRCGEERGRAPIDFGKRATGKKNQKPDFRRTFPSRAARYSVTSSPAEQRVA
jgi:hypothetical protein